MEDRSLPSYAPEEDEVVEFDPNVGYKPKPYKVPHKYLSRDRYFAASEWVKADNIEKGIGEDDDERYEFGTRIKSTAQ